MEADVEALYFGLDDEHSQLIGAPTTGASFSMQEQEPRDLLVLPTLTTMLAVSL